jgi:hypothetical protein
VRAVRRAARRREGEGEGGGGGGDGRRGRAPRGRRRPPCRASRRRRRAPRVRRAPAYDAPRSPQTFGDEGLCEHRSSGSPARRSAIDRRPGSLGEAKWQAHARRGSACSRRPCRCASPPPLQNHLRRARRARRALPRARRAWARAAASWVLPRCVHNFPSPLLGRARGLPVMLDQSLRPEPYVDDTASAEGPRPRRRRRHACLRRPPAAARPPPAVRILRAAPPGPWGETSPIT